MIRFPFVSIFAFYYCGFAENLTARIPAQIAKNPQLRIPQILICLIKSTSPYALKFKTITASHLKLIRFLH